ncbi:GspH/FimT family pseudopilin [Piscinibacter defluvii]|uniref:GspH/FimT family pseudopilin n=1 Tax=Piscinibacter defluvii TaxID=1796922 RepID=UPI0013E38CB8|nr:GspH/FimT family pseudopilin [Piscinibacter defluvii]
MTRQHAHRHARQHGLSLVETTVTLGLAAVVAGLAAPNLNTVLELRRLDGAATQLAGDLQFARGEALARNRPVRLSLDAAQACYLVHTGAAADCRCAGDGSATCSGGAQAIRSVAWGAGERIGLQASSGSLLFDPRHGTATPSATLRVVAADGRAIHHVVNVMGRLRSCSPLAAVPGYRAC